VSGQTGTSGFRGTELRAPPDWLGDAREEAMDQYRQRSDGLAKIDKVIALLATEDRWCKFFGMSSDGRRCLWGALWAEDAATILEAPVLRAIEQVTRCRYESIDAFNDHPATTHPMILAVLYRARQDLQVAMSPSAPRYRWSPAPSGWHAPFEVGFT
jgi:hypothetical protein